MRFRLLALLGAVLSAGVALAADPVTRTIPAPPPAVTKSLPESLDDLKAFQQQTREVIDKVIPCTVCLQVGGASGSGVIVSEDGLILTAGHVSGEPGRKIKVILHDGRRVDGITLGRWSTIDSGMAQITTEGKWPYAELGVSKDLKPGQWCIATGHPGGYKKDRPPVVRVGRIGFGNDSLVQSDCTLVGGDSGGPLFDMTGKVIGIHSRIGNPLTANIHVPVDTYRDTWDQLVKSERIGEVQVWLGVKADEFAKNCKLGDITKDSPAEKAGLKAGDIITRFGGKEVASYQDMVKLLQKRKPGDEVALELKRGDETKELKITLGKRKD
jgi:serine protease Do